MTVKFTVVWLNLSSPSSHQLAGWIFVDLHLINWIEPQLRYHPYNLVHVLALNSFWINYASNFFKSVSLASGYCQTFNLFISWSFLVTIGIDYMKYCVSMISSLSITCNIPSKRWNIYYKSNVFCIQARVCVWLLWYSDAQRMLVWQFSRDLDRMCRRCKYVICMCM